LFDLGQIFGDQADAGYVVIPARMFAKGRECELGRQGFAGVLGVATNQSL
jgi:hypothetical protein